MGASGDLVPLSYLAAAVTGERSVLREADARCHRADREIPRGRRRLTYAQALACVDSLAQSLLDRGLDRPVMILGGNSIFGLV
ncbi:hypothetical protein [Herbidospora cretacea]|uniref:hypothetical protein n=1 Tax=Herbidospora cretacea TaxID=28444 RepID=UPI000A42DCBE